MKPTLRLATVALAAVTLAASALPAFAQDPATPPAAPPAAQGGPGGRGGRGGPGGGGMGRRAMENLSPEEQTRVQTARQATNRDPAVVEARRALMQAEREAMLKQDPTLGPVLDKMHPHGGPGGGGAGFGKGKKNKGLAAGGPAADAPDDGKGLPMLTPEERTRLINAQRAARQDAAVVSARQVMQSATTPEAKRAARQTMQEALRAAMTRADAGIGPILEKAGRGGQGRV